jgi:hypothetical protein
MIRPGVEDVPLGPGMVRDDRSDVAMNVLQYGAAILAIVVVTLLTVVR